MSDPKDLRSYLSTVAADERFKVEEIEARVEPDLELSAIVKRAESPSSPIMIFRSVEGSAMPVVSGLYACRKRIALALGTDEKSVSRHFLNCLARPTPTVAAVAAPVKDVRLLDDEVDLGKLPITTHAEGDSGRYITAGVGLSKNPDNGVVNAGIYRLQIIGPRQFTVGADPDNDLGRLIRRARDEGTRVPFAVVIGHHPAFTLASQADHPTTIDSLEVAGALLGEPLQVVPAETVDLPVPAHAEIVIEGFIDPTDSRTDGPFAEFTYHYGTGKAPVCTVTAITHRRDAHYVDIHNVHVEHRCLFISGYEPRLLDRIMQTVDCGVVAVHMPFEGAGLHANIALANPTPAEARAALSAALDHEKLFLKHVIVVDDDIDPTDWSEVMWAVTTRFQADRDIVLQDGGRGLSIDPSTWRADASRKNTNVGFDATLGSLRAEFPRADMLPDDGICSPTGLSRGELEASATG